jgi:hypothetical protein
MVFLERTLSSKFNPLVLLAKSTAKGFVNRFNGEGDWLVLAAFFRLLTVLSSLSQSSSSVSSNLVKSCLRSADVSLTDDLGDHWTAQPHKKERNWLVEQVQKLSLEKHVRISWMSGDVHA